MVIVEHGTGNSEWRMANVEWRVLVLHSNFRFTMQFNIILHNNYAVQKRALIFTITTYLIQDLFYFCLFTFGTLKTYHAVLPTSYSVYYRPILF